MKFPHISIQDLENYAIACGTDLHTFVDTLDMIVPFSLEARAALREQGFGMSLSAEERRIILGSLRQM